jgi:diaphanous 1
MTIPKLKERLDAMVFRRKFDLSLAEVMPDLGILHSAASELKSSDRFRSLLQVGLCQRISRETHKIGRAHPGECH